MSVPAIAKATEERILALDSYVTFKVETPSDVIIANAALLAAEELKNHEDLIKIREAKAQAHTLHKTLTSLCNKYDTPIERVQTHLRSEIALYDDRVRKQVAEANEQLKQKAIAAHQEAVTNADPWEDQPLPPEPAQIPVPRLPVSGLSMRNKPMRVVIDGFEQDGVHSQGWVRFIIEVADRLKAGDNSFLQYTTPNIPAMNESARRWGKEITEAKMPGVKVVQEKTVARRG